MAEEMTDPKTTLRTILLLLRPPNASTRIKGDFRSSQSENVGLAARRTDLACAAYSRNADNHANAATP
jgi:hypothetical protein